MCTACEVCSRLPPTLAPPPTVTESAPRGEWPTRISTSWRNVFHAAWVSEIEARCVGSHPTKASTTLRWSMREWSGPLAEALVEEAGQPRRRTLLGHAGRAARPAIAAPAAAAAVAAATTIAATAAAAATVAAGTTVATTTAARVAAEGDAAAAEGEAHVAVRLVQTLRVAEEIV
eukprot:scaffold99588_cov48-Phaeocystis_antarctica.AAC.4